MKNLIILITAILLVSSCGNKMYSYRKYMKADPAVATNTEKAKTIKKAVRATPTKPETENVQPETSVASEKTTTVATENEIASAATAVSIAPLLKGLEKYKAAEKSSEQVPVSKKISKKQIKKDIKESVSLSGYSQPVRLMILGLIIILVGVIIGIISGLLGWLLTTIGLVVFLIGLILFLVDLA